METAAAKGNASSSEAKAAKGGAEDAPFVEQPEHGEDAEEEKPPQDDAVIG